MPRSRPPSSRTRGGQPVEIRSRVAAARPRIVAFLLLLALATAASCGGDNGDDGTVVSPPPPSLPPPPPPSPPPPATQEQREAKVLEDAADVESLLNDFWTRELQQLYTLAFDPPDRFETYRGNSNAPCGGQQQAGANNAYYCFPDADEYVAFDLDWFQNYLINHPGGATTFLILAHEWGHAVQDTWKETGGGDTWSPAYRQELNADCLAGVFLSRSIAEGSIIEEAGDADAIYSWLYEVGGPWFNPGTHGTQEERITAFNDGVQHGTGYCRMQY